LVKISHWGRNGHSKKHLRYNLQKAAVANALDAVSPDALLLSVFFRARLSLGGPRRARAGSAGQNGSESPQAGASAGAER
jgi:hypothetical protein